MLMSSNGFVLYPCLAPVKKSAYEPRFASAIFTPSVSSTQAVWRAFRGLVFLAFHCVASHASFAKLTLSYFVRSAIVPRCFYPGLQIRKALSYHELSFVG